MGAVPVHYPNVRVPRIRLPNTIRLKVKLRYNAHVGMALISFRIETRSFEVQVRPGCFIFGCNAESNVFSVVRVPCIPGALRQSGELMRLPARKVVLVDLRLCLFRSGEHQNP